MSDTPQSSETMEEEMLLEEIEYLKKVVDDVEKRREVIENKIGQIFGQASIVLSIVSLFIPLIPSQMEGIELCSKVLVLLPFFCTILCFLIAIWLSSNTLLIAKFRFAHLSSTTITKPDRVRNKTEFRKEYINDLVYIDECNNEVINQKGNTLILAGNFFRAGLIILGVFIILISVIASSKNETPTKVQITNLNTFKGKIETVTTTISTSSYIDSMIGKADTTMTAKEMPAKTKQ